MEEFSECEKCGIVLFLGEKCERCVKIVKLSAQFRYHLKKTYNIDPEEYISTFKEQDGGCASCKVESGGRRMSVFKGKSDILRLVCPKCDVVVRTGKNNLDAVRFLVEEVL